MTSTADQTADFLNVAVAHGLLTASTAENINVEAEQKKLQASDVALETSAMAPWCVDATKLLMSPTGLIPDYELTGLLGCGAAGIVFRAKQKSLNRDVALKTINLLGRSSAMGERRIKQEAQAIARLHHPNIVVAFDSGFHQGRFCIAMELVVGQSLEELIESEAPLGESITWKIIRQAASGLCHAERSGIIHRDIKPGNLLLSDAPSGIDHDAGVPFVKIVDFGLALDEGLQKEDRLTVTGATLGTPAYVAPEQLQNTNVDCRADIFSLGATAFHMLSGSAPFAGQPPMKAILQKTIGDDSWRNTLSDSISEASRQLITDMTASEPADRLPDYASLLQRIDELQVSDLDSKRGIGQKFVGAMLKKSTGKSHKWIRSRYKWLVLGLMIVVVLGVINQTKIRSFLSQLPGIGNAANPDGIDNPEDVRELQATWTTSLQTEQLFNGDKIVSKNVRQSGTWTNNKVDGTYVANERASLTFPLQTSAGISNVSLSFSVYLMAEDSQMEVRIKASPSSQGGTIVLQEGLVTFEPADAESGQAESFTFGKADAGDPAPPHTFEIRREGNRIIARLKGVKVADFFVADGSTCEVVARSKMNRCGMNGMKLAELIPVVESQ